MDVRLDPIGPVNRFIIWVFTGKKPRVLRRMVSIIFHIELPTLQFPLRMTHPYGIIISGDVVLGKNVTVFQGVTIGSKRDGKKAGSPTIEDDVCIFPNAVLIGRIKVGRGAIVAPGSVVIEDVPAGATVAGNPAKVIHQAYKQEELVL
jgi:serine acetyltransferase